MTPMLGENVLPESVNDVRRRVRSSVRSVREPIRQTRKDLIPGPDLIGQAESSVMNLRDRFMSRDRLLDRIRSQQGGMTSDSSSSGSSNNDSNTPAT